MVSSDYAEAAKMYLQLLYIRLENVKISALPTCCPVFLLVFMFWGRGWGEAMNHLTHF